MSRGFTTAGIEALDGALARHVERGELPGLVALVARGDDVHVAAIGTRAFGDGEPIGRDAIFRIASIVGHRADGARGAHPRRPGQGPGGG